MCCRVTVCRSSICGWSDADAGTAHCRGARAVSPSRRRVRVRHVAEGDGLFADDPVGPAVLPRHRHDVVASGVRPGEGDRRAGPRDVRTPGRGRETQAGSMIASASSFLGLPEVRKRRPERARRSRPVPARRRVYVPRPVPVPVVVGAGAGTARTRPSAAARAAAVPGRMPGLSRGSGVLPRDRPSGPAVVRCQAVCRVSPYRFRISLIGWCQVSPPELQLPHPPEVTPCAWSPLMKEPPESPGSAHTLVLVIW